MTKRRTQTYGFAHASGLLKSQIRKVSETRGFARVDVLTKWAELVGEDFASVSRPVDISYSRKGGMGSTLRVLTTGPQAPLLEMKKEELRARINSVYGYQAISRIQITQTAATGFAEGQASFQHRPKTRKAAQPDPQVAQEARETASDVTDPGLRQALEQLATNVISKNKRGA